MNDKEKDEKVYFWLKKCPVSLISISGDLITKLDSIARKYHCACFKCEKLDPEETLSTSTVMNNGLGSANFIARCKICGYALESI